MADNQRDDDYQREGGESKVDVARLKVLVKENLYSGITVSLVSLPLSSALAMASGATAMMGLITAIYGPAVAGVLGGSHYNILGPAGALVNILQSLTANNTVDIVPYVAFLAGFMSFLVYLFKLEKYCTMLPTSVLEGFSLGVATTIGLGQLGFALGIYGLPKQKAFYLNVLQNFENLDKM